MKQRFHWDDWNLGHMKKHQISRLEAEYVVRNVSPPFPRTLDSEKSLVRGTTSNGRIIQVIYVLHDDENIDYECMTLEDIVSISDAAMPVPYIIHARELTAREKSKFRQTQ